MRKSQFCSLSPRVAQVEKLRPASAAQPALGRGQKSTEELRPRALKKS